MTLRYTNQRSSPRTLIVCPISINFHSGTAHGIVRDISAGGIFFYSNYKPAVGTSLDFSLHFKDKKVTGQGEVVRVEQRAPGAAIGVAVRISRSLERGADTY